MGAGMAERPLTPEEAALWARVLARVTPLRAQPAATLPPVAPPPPAAPIPVARKPRGRVPPPRPAPVTAPKTPTHSAATLDASWDRRLARGMVAPDRTIDLHGETLSSAYARLDEALGAAIAGGDRLILLVTGRPPRPESERPHARGAIRAAVGDWLAASRHADRIAAVRAAAPRHGGAGALYIILRRERPRAVKS
jgi:DNA-nicking Smr family endonuclease